MPLVLVLKNLEGDNAVDLRYEEVLSVDPGKGGKSDFSWNRQIVGPNSPLNGGNPVVDDVEMRLVEVTGIIPAMLLKKRPCRRRRSRSPRALCHRNRCESP